MPDSVSDVEPLKCPNCGADHQLTPFCGACGFPLYPTSYKEAQAFLDFIPEKERAVFEGKWQHIVQWNRLLITVLLIGGFLLYGWWMVYVLLAPLGYLSTLALFAWIVSEEPGRLVRHYSALYSFGFAPAIYEPGKEDVEILRQRKSWRWIVFAMYVIYVAGIAVMLWMVGYTPDTSPYGARFILVLPVPKGAIIIKGSRKCFTPYAA